MYIVMDLEFNCPNNSYVSEKNGVIFLICAIVAWRYRVSHE